LEINNHHQIKQSNRKLFGQISAFICVHLRLIFVSLSDRTRKIKFELFPIQEKIDPANNNQAHSCLNLLENKPQINADERRFVNLNIQHLSELYQGNSLTDIFDQCASLFHPPNNKPQRSQRTQSRIANLCALHVIYGRLTLFTAWLTRIYPYPCASASSAQSVFYYTPSLFCVHPRLILSMLEKTAAFYHTSINKANTIFNQKSDLNDRYLLLQRA
jgi:hypothetical protein